MTQIALCQLNSGDDPEANLKLIREGVESAAASGARIVVFPEATMARFGRPLDPVAEPLDGPWASAVAAVAAEHDVVVVAGMFTPAGERVRNTLLVTGGGLHLGYDKIHLYDAFGFAESDTVAPGSAPVTFVLDGVTFGVATCYDVRFPELFRSLSAAGAQLLTIPSAFTSPTGRAHWETLLRARAIENLCYVIAPAQSGFHPSGRETYGDSMIVDYWGRVLQRLPRGRGSVVADIDLGAQAEVRNNFPALQHRIFRNS